jgi:HEPN domain-containing protein
MPKRSKTVDVPRREAQRYVEKAVEFVEQARDASSSSRHDAAVLNAIHAAISAADAVTVALSGRRSSDPDHQRVADLLEDVAANSSEIRSRTRQLRTLLAKKNVVEYESRRATAREAADAVTRAERLVAWSEDLVRRAKLT